MVCIVFKMIILKEDIDCKNVTFLTIQINFIKFQYQTMTLFFRKMFKPKSMKNVCEILAYFFLE